MKCEVCDKEVANSEELKAHMEREHSPDERDGDLEMPDLMQDREEPAATVRDKSSDS